MRIRVGMLGVLAFVGVASDLQAQNVQTVDPGRTAFESRCARCHGADGNGGEMGPPIAERLAPLEDQQIAKLIRDGAPAKGMPPSVVDDPEMAALLKFLRTIQRQPSPVVRTKLQMTDGRSLEGQLLGEGFDDVQVRTDDKRVHLLRRSGNRFRAVTSETGWPTYNGETGGNRYTTLTQIDKTNVSKLAPRWMFTVPDAGALQVTPVVVDGIMYVTAPNQCFALDAGSGRRIWHYKRPRTKGVVQGNANRGAGVAGDRVFMVTDHAHIIALNRFTGELLWDSEARRLAQELRRVVGTASGRQSDHFRCVRRRARCERLRGRSRSGDRQGGLAFLDRAQAGRARVGDLAGQGHRARRRADLVHRQLRSRPRHCLLADR